MLVVNLHNIVAHTFVYQTAISMPVGGKPNRIRILAPDDAPIGLGRSVHVANFTHCWNTLYLPRYDINQHKVEMGQYHSLATISMSPVPAQAMPAYKCQSRLR